MDTLHRVLDFCIRHQTVLGYSFVSLMTAAIEYIFSAVVFKCPCNSENMLYGSVFLMVPAFILFLLGYMMNPRMWRLMTGICTPEKSCSYSPWGTCAGCFCVLLQVTARAVVAPLTWLAVALLRDSFYECMASGSSLIKNLMCKDKGAECHEMLVKIPCDEKLSEKISSEFLSLQAQSQMIGWFLITAIMTVALIVKCISRCCSPFTYLQLKFWKTYSKNECEFFEAKAKEHASKLSERNVNCFFESTDPAPFQTPSNEDWQKISVLYAFNSQEQYYSTLHKYINTNRGSNVRLGKGDQNPTGLGLVNETIASQSDV